MILRPWKFQVIAADIRLRISGFPLWTMACVHMYGDYRGLGRFGEWKAPSKSARSTSNLLRRDFKKKKENTLSN